MCNGKCIDPAWPSTRIVGQVLRLRAFPLKGGGKQEARDFTAAKLSKVLIDKGYPTAQVSQKAQDIIARIGQQKVLTAVDGGMPAMGVLQQYAKQNNVQLFDQQEEKQMSAAKIQKALRARRKKAEPEVTPEDFAPMPGAFVNEDGAPCDYIKSYEGRGSGIMC